MVNSTVMILYAVQNVIKSDKLWKFLRRKYGFWGKIIRWFYFLYFRCVKYFIFLPSV
jgi:hypothetical protein